MQNRPKKLPKIDATSITIFDPSWEALGGRFGRVLGAMLGPSWPMLAPCWAQVGPGNHSETMLKTMSKKHLENRAPEEIANSKPGGAGSPK